MRRRSHEDGLSLIEAMVAVLIAIVGVFSVGSVIYIATVMGNNQGSQATRAAVYAQDKIEKLLSLDFNPNTSDPNSCDVSAALQPASCNTTGITANGWTQGLLAGGATGPMVVSCAAAAAGYEDFLDAQGVQLAASGCSTLPNTAVFIRQWQIADLTSPSAGPPLKQITVAVYSLSAEDRIGGIPIVILTSVVSDPN